MILLYYIISTKWIYSQFKYYKDGTYTNFNKTKGIIIKTDLNYDKDCSFLSMDYIYYAKNVAIIGHKHIFPDLKKYNEKEFIERFISDYPINKHVTVYYRQINNFPYLSYDSYLEIDTIETMKQTEWYYDLFLYNNYLVVIVLGLDILCRLCI